jgi:predicted CXXCH cytochrome family protein
VWALSFGIIVVGIAGWFGWRSARVGPSSASRHARYVGAARCSECHRAQYDGWRSSQHAHAMQPATERTVLGDFHDARFTEGADTSVFSRAGNGYRVRTEGPDGRPADFAVKYAFGVYPLQQYLLQMPGGRMQALSVAWDARPRAEGGQKWLHLYPGQGVEHTSELHWSGLQQNWNFMCADCHSTNVRKGYDAASDQFRTVWSEMNVSCEACHGPGSRHVTWARTPRWLAALLWRDPGLAVRLTERTGVHWTTDSTTGTPHRSATTVNRREIATCAPCHSRRTQVAEGWVPGAPLLDHYVPSLIMPGLYHADGQQRDEVYTYGSFLQSRMYRAGVTCSDCHEPHSQRLRASGNALCTRCHAAARFDTASHHFHRAGTVGAACVSCHMPARTYMQVDARRDHSLRVPRPDRSTALGAPDACTGCHTDRDPGWAANELRNRLGHTPSGEQRFAEAFSAHERGAPAADSLLLAIVRESASSSYVRASALARLADRPGAAAAEGAQLGILSADPEMRHAALAVVEALPAERRAGLASRLLGDPVRAVRTQAAWTLATVARTLADEDARAFAQAADEFIASQRLNADRPEARITLGTFFATLGRSAEAETELRTAIRRFPRAAPAYVNLADVYRAQGRDAEAERVLREGVMRAPDDPALHSALGMTLARTGRASEAVAELARAASLERSPRHAYTYAVALNSTGKAREAIDVLDAALARYPDDRDLLFALATFHRDAGARDQARRAAERLVLAHPDDEEGRALLQSLVTTGR